MKIISIVDYLGYTFFRAAGFIFRLIPVSIGLWIARRLGSLFYYLNRKRAFIAYRNLKAAFGRDYSPKCLKRIIKTVYQNLMQTFIEVLTFPRIDDAYVRKFVKFEGFENIDEASRKGKGIVFLTGHFGNWELFSIVGGIKGLDMLVLAREQKHSRLNDLLNDYRELTGSHVIKKGFAIKDMLQGLRENKIMGMLVDQDAGRKGVFVDFFGRKTSFAHGAMGFTLRTDAVILPVFIIREKGPYHRIIIEKPLRIEKGPDEEGNIKNGTQRFAAIFESYIRKYPEQWLWLHKRWKSTPNRKILILNDGRAGHLNQSIAVAEMIQKYRKELGYAMDDTSYSIVDVHFKNKFLRTLFSCGSIFSSKFCSGCMQCLEFCHTKKTYKELMGEYADIVISCGSTVEPVNLLLSRELGAKNVVIMKPAYAPVNRFDLVIAPRHDRVPKKDNVIIIEGAPTRITQDKLEIESRILSEKLGLSKNVRIGVLIGGDNQEFRLTPEIIHGLVDALIEAACTIDAEILVTTSRRTPGEAEKILKERLAHHLRCKLLVIANERNIPEAVSGILGLSQIIIVSCESVSMISEALHSSRYAFVLKLEKKRKKFSKHDRFLKNLEEGSYIKLVDAAGLFEAIKDVWDFKPPVRKLEDNIRIYDGIRKAGLV